MVVTFMHCSFRSHKITWLALHKDLLKRHVCISRSFSDETDAITRNVIWHWQHQSIVLKGEVRSFVKMSICIRVTGKVLPLTEPQLQGSRWIQEYQSIDNEWCLHDSTSSEYRQGWRILPQMVRNKRLMFSRQLISSLSCDVKVSQQSTEVFSLLSVPV